MDLLGLRRTAQGILGALGTARSLDPKTIAAAYGPDPDFDLYSIEEVPLRELSERKVRLPSGLARAWDRLAHATFDGDALFDVLLVCLETVPNLEGTSLPLRLPEEPAPVRPTAANPRAYRGTRHRPPKPARPGRLDLRPYLCDARGQALLRARLARLLPHAIERLVEAGYDRARLARLADPVDPYWAYHHGDDPTPLPPGFLALLPLLRELPVAKLSAWRGLFHDLALPSHDPLLRALVRLVHAAGPERALAWARAIQFAEAEQRSTLATLIVEAGAATHAPPDEALWDRALAGTPLAYRAYATLAALVQGVVPAYVAAALTLLDRGAASELFGPSMPLGSPGLDAYRVIAIVEHIPIDDGYYRDPFFSRRRVFRLCGLVPGLAEVLPHIDLVRCAPSSLGPFLEALAVHHLRNGTPTERADNWSTLRRSLPELLRCVHETPERHQERALDLLNTALWFWSDEQLRECLAPAIEVIWRISRPPFDVYTLEGWALCWLIDDPATRGELLEGPHETLRILEEVLRDNARATTIGAGLANLDRTKSLRAFIADCFISFPRQTLDAMHRWGSLTTEHAERIASRFLTHPLLDPALAKQPLDGLLTLLEPLIARGLHNPVPRKLRLRRDDLSPAQIERAHRLLLRDLALTRLDLLSEMAIEALGAPLGSHAPAHALQYIKAAELNRRAYRAFLRADAQGNHHYRLEHPRTQAWVKRHPRLDIARFMEGIRLEAQVAPHARVTLSIEPDPFDVLELGRVGRSCLQLGGLAAYSATAVVLDINKQVVYARTEKGTPIARQIVAVSEAETLVCFSVYPIDTPATLQRLFRRYDEAFAQALGVPLERDRKYEIAAILSHEFWDDGLWNGEVEPDQDARR